MRSVLFIITILAHIPGLSQAKLVLEGNYQGSNLFIQNPMVDMGFCVDSIYINDVKYEPDPASSAFEIVINDSIKIGAPLNVVIYHEKGCKPKNLTIQNPTKSNIQFENIVLNDSSILSANIITDNSITVWVEQYRWNKWVKIYRTEIRTSGGNVVFDLAKELHTGENKFRIVCYNPFAKKSCSLVRARTSPAPAFDFHYLRDENLIYFDQWTMYELFDAFGNIVFRGEGTEFTVRQYKKGAYYLNFDNINVKLYLKPKK
ncbi:MAG: hypothetical protein ACI857_003267 [Arenicella sp.]|jgi:hypothetical protein